VKDKTHKTVVAFGEVLWDILPLAMVLGGAPFNFTYRINALGNTGLMISRLGKDALGEKAFRKIQSLGMPTDLIEWDDNFPTGTVEVSFDAYHNPDYVIIPQVAYDQIGVDENLLNRVSMADCICFGTLSQRSKKSATSLRIILEAAQQAVKFLDINLRKACYSLESITFSLRNSDILKLNQAESEQVAEMLGYGRLTIPDFCARMIENWQLRYCIVTLAEKGAFVRSADGESEYEPGYAVSLVDSLGAGDAFSAGFVHQILQGKSTLEACFFGNKLGAQVAMQKGATVPIHLADLNQFDHGHYKRNIHPDLEEYIK
jgi:fructokinase